MGEHAICREHLREGGGIKSIIISHRDRLFTADDDADTDTYDSDADAAAYGGDEL